MGLLKDLVPRKVSGSIKQYGEQPDSQSYHHGDYSSNVSRASKFVPKYETKERRGKSAIHADDIEWARAVGKPQIISVNRPLLLQAMRQLMEGRRSPYNRLYRILQRFLQKLKYPEMIMQFRIIATGTDPEREKFGTFIKVVLELGDNREFALPSSFPEDCRSAILKVPPQ